MVPGISAKKSIICICDLLASTSGPPHPASPFPINIDKLFFPTMMAMTTPVGQQSAVRCQQSFRSQRRSGAGRVQCEDPSPFALHRTWLAWCRVVRFSLQDGIAVLLRLSKQPLHRCRCRGCLEEPSGGMQRLLHRWVAPGRLAGCPDTTCRPMRIAGSVAHQRSLAEDACALFGSADRRAHAPVQSLRVACLCLPIGLAVLLAQAQQRPLSGSSQSSSGGSSPPASSSWQLASRQPCWCTARPLTPAWSFRKAA